MADIACFCEAVFADVATRDHAKGIVEDFMERTSDTMPYGGVVGYPVGMETVTQIHLAESDGPGFRFCYRIPEALSMDYGTMLNQIDALALDYNSGNGAIA